MDIKIEHALDKHKYYTLRNDEYCYRIDSWYEKKDKDDNYTGEFANNPKKACFPATITQAIRSVLQKQIKDSEADSLKVLLNDILLIQNNIEEKIKELIKEGGKK